MTHPLKSFGTIAHSAAVAPDDGRSQGLVILIQAYQPVHLVRDTDGTNFIFLKWIFIVKQAGRLHQFLPPVLRILLGKTRLWRIYLHFRRGRKSRSQWLTTACVQQGSFYG